MTRASVLNQLTIVHSFLKVEHFMEVYLFSYLEGSRPGREMA